MMEIYKNMDYEDIKIGDLVAFKNNDTLIYGIIVIKNFKFDSVNGCLWGYWYKDLKQVISVTEQNYPNFSKLQDSYGMAGWISPKMAIMIKPRFLVNHFIK
jgi:hypothetical protein